MDVCHWTRAGRCAPKSTRFILLPKRWVVERTLAQLVSALNKDYELFPETAEILYLPCHPHYGQAIGMKLTSHNFSNIL